jgi:hypothetical protein
MGQATMAMIEAGPEVLILKRASASRRSGHWSDDDFDVLCNGAVVGRIFNANAAPVGSPWMWTLIFPHQPTGTLRPERPRCGHSPRAGDGINQGPSANVAIMFTGGLIMPLIFFNAAATCYLSSFTAPLAFMEAWKKALERAE